MCCDWSRGEGARIYQLWRAVCRVQPGAGLQPGEHRGPLNTDQGLHCGNSGGTLAIWCTVGTVAVVITLHGGNICTLCTVARDNGANCGAARGYSVAPVDGCGHLSAETNKYHHRYMLLYFRMHFQIQTEMLQINFRTCCENLCPK